MKKFTFSTLVLALVCASHSFAAKKTALKHITILGTNDIHGGVEAQLDAKTGDTVGGLDFFSGVVQSIRTGLTQKEGDSAGVLLVDAGDQFQGTLVSNYNEGVLLFSIFNQIGYDVAVPGNHDYDFGPKGWLVDQSNDPSKRREVLESLAGSARFPLLAANTYLLNSLKDKNGNSLKADSDNCKVQGGGEIDWSTAQRPSFFQQYVIKQVAGVRVALIGMDLPGTKEVTTADNVTDLCFADSYDTYVRMHDALKSQADVFVLVFHNGNTTKDKSLSALVKRINANGQILDAVVSGHTHYNLNEKVGDVPVIQSGAGGENFGRIDLYWDSKSQTLQGSKTKGYAGIPLNHSACAKDASSFCEKRGESVSYEGVPVQIDAAVTSLILAADSEVAPLANRVLGQASANVKKDRVNENALSNLVTDQMRIATQSDIAFLNMGGLREDIPQGPITYANFFKVFPFSNHMIAVGPMHSTNIVNLVKRSIQSCGAFGSLLPSGIKVKFSHNCAGASELDTGATLLNLQTLDGTVLYDSVNGLSVDKTFQVVTVDFLLTGGDGFSDFVGIPQVQDYGIMREVLVDKMLTNPVQWDNSLDGRWQAVTAP